MRSSAATLGAESAMVILDSCSEKRKKNTGCKDGQTTIIRNYVGRPDFVGCYMLMHYYEGKGKLSVPHARHLVVTTTQVDLRYINCNVNARMIQV